MSTYTMIKDKACRFLFSCFLYRADKDDRDNHIGYELLARWNLEDLDSILPAVSIFNKVGPSRAEKPQRVIELLKWYFQKFFGLV